MFPSRRASLKVFSTGFTNIYLVRFGIFFDKYIFGQILKICFSLSFISTCKQRCITLETDVLKMLWLSDVNSFWGFLLSLVLLSTVYHPGQFFSDGWPREAGSGSGSGRTCFSWKLWFFDMTMIDKPANDVLPACRTAIHLEKSFCDWCRFFVTYNFVWNWFF